MRSSLILIIAAVLFSNTSNCQINSIPEFDKRIDVLFAGNPLATTQLVSDYYIQALVNDLKLSGKIPTDSIYNYIKNRARKQYGTLINDQKKLLSDLVNKGAKRIQQYVVDYGDITKPIYNQNDFVQVSPYAFNKLYKYASKSLIDTIASRINDHADVYIISEYKKLSTLLTDRIRNGNKEAIDEFFGGMAQSLKQKLGTEKNEQLAKFSAELAKFREKLSKPGFVDSLVSKLDEFCDLGDFNLQLLKDRVENEVQKIDLTYLTIRLAEISSVDKTIIDRLKNLDVTGIEGFIKQVEQEGIKKFNETIKTQTENLLQIQESYKEKLKKSSTQLQEFVNKAGKTVENIGNIENEYRKVVNTLPYIADKDILLGNLIQAGQNKLNSELKSFYDKYMKEPVKKMEAALFLASFFVDTKDISSAIRDVKGSLPFKANDIDKEFAKAKESLLKTNAGFVSNVNAYLNTANLVIGSFQALGIGNPATMAKISQGIQTGQAVFSAVTAFASGNYLGAISGLGGMMGGGDPGAARHAEIMAALGQINAKLDVVLQKLDVILENQAKMYDLQKHTFKYLVDLRDTVLKRFDQLNEKVDIMDTKINFLIARDFLDQLNACTEICNALGLTLDSNKVDYVKLRKVWAGKIVSENEKIERLFNDHKYLLLPSERINPTYLNSVFENVAQISKEEKAELAEFDKFYDDLFNKAKASIGNFYQADQNEKLTLSLLAPAFNYRELSYKLKQPKILRSGNQKEITLSHIADYVSPEICRSTAEMILRYHPIIAVTDRHYELIPADADFMIKSLPRMETAEKYISDALVIINSSIAEQNLLSGDYLLETMREEYKRYLASPKEDINISMYNNNNKLLSNSAAGLFFNNFIRYYISKEIDLSSGTGRPFTYASYKYAYGSKDSILMNTGTLRFPYKIIYVDKAKKDALKAANINVTEELWYATVQGKYYVMPDPAEFENSEGVKISHTRYLNTLLYYRDKLINEWESYKLISEFSQPDKKAVNYAYIVSD